MSLLLMMAFLACTGDPPPTPEPQPDDDALTFSSLTALPPLVFAEGPPPERVSLPTDDMDLLWSTQAGRAILTRGETYDDARLVDLIDHKILATLPRPRVVNWEAGLLSVRPTGEKIEALVTLADGRIYRPAITLGDNAAVDAAVLVLSKAGVVLVAKGDNGKAWYGPWTDPTTAKVELSSPLPAWPSGSEVDHRGRPEVWTANGVPGDEGDCVRWRIDQDTPKCVAVKSPEPTAQRRNLSAGWSVVSSWNGGIQLYRDTQPIPWRLPEECSWNLSAVLTEPPRVLAECQPDRNQPERRRRLWSPDDERAWTRMLPPNERGTFRTRTVRDVVLPEALPGISPRLVGRWIDMKTGQGWRSPMLMPLRADTSPSPAFARDPETGQVAAIDTRAGTLQAFEGVGEECPFDLVEMYREDNFVVLSCYNQPRTDYYVFHQLFSVVLDLKRQRTWRVEEMPGQLLAGGRLLVDDRAELRAEGDAPFKNLTLLTFAAPQD